AGVDRPGALGPQRRVGGDAALIEVELAEARRSEGESPAGAQLDRAGRPGPREHREGRAQPELAADAVETHRGVQRDVAARERDLVAQRSGGDRPPTQAGLVPDDEVLASGE